ncbi:hypothetical protein A3709_20550 [Halioglobus sp. HI00S01]|nr:hypothetical protein A3709_20550 [Halioglobus sp. HI00S01]
MILATCTKLLRFMAEEINKVSKGKGKAGASSGRGYEPEGAALSKSTLPPQSYGNKRFGETNQSVARRMVGVALASGMLPLQITQLQQKAN